MKISPFLARSALFLFLGLALLAWVAGCDEERELLPYSLIWQVATGENGELYAGGSYTPGPNSEATSVLWRREDGDWVVVREIPVGSGGLDAYFGICVTDDDDFYVGSIGGAIHHYSGGQWASTSVADQEKIYWLERSGGKIWAYSLDSVLHLDGGSWQVFTDFGEDSPTPAVAVVAEDSVVAVAGDIARVVAGSFTRVDTLLAQVNRVIRHGERVIAAGDSVLALAGEEWSYLGDLPEDDTCIFMEARNDTVVRLFGTRGTYELVGDEIQTVNAVGSFPGINPRNLALFQDTLFGGKIDRSVEGMQFMGVVWRLEAAAWVRDWNLSVSGAKARSGLLGQE